jgi:hypothetical protein
MKEIKLTQGKVALVDDDDYDYLNQWRWYAHKDKNTFYALRKEARNMSRIQKDIKMHRLIMNTPDGMQVDHIDHDGLNNQKSNLRNCTSAQNGKNRQCNHNRKYKGVYIVKDKYVARIHVDGKNCLLGYYETEIEALQSYDNAALKYYGEFASLNLK